MSVLDALDGTPGEAGAKMGIVAKFKMNINLRGSCTFDRFDRPLLEFTETGCRKVAGNAVDAGAVRAVRRDLGRGWSGPPAPAD